ncbi:AEC family transporter [Sutterella sp.]|uniref:AEC family transporter n=1 Tax=Sutterella sp. TaxID=1981025 RepID=UPI0026E07A85|nr:AEC family transporter [Sutterella sp.]MDO5531206.1 AEC family transporter [Sutterella sp.]
MESVLTVLPDFAIILLGFVLAKFKPFPRSFWGGIEVLVFNVLLPPMLFLSVANSHFSFAGSAKFLAAGLGAMALAVLTSWCIRYVVKADPITHASLFQCGFRYNAYIGFPLCMRFCGDEGMSLLALLMSVWVPISNTLSVAVLATAVAARTGGGAPDKRKLLVTTCKAVFKNPLIIATMLGFLFNMSGLEMPRIGVDFLRHLSNASLSMGLLTIGAALKIGAIRENLSLIAATSLQRLVIVPLLGALCVWFFGVTGAAAGVVLLFAASPTAQSCYVMTAAMGGNAPPVAAVTTAQTLLSIFTLSALILIWFA